MSDAAEKAIKDAEAALRAFETFCGNQPPDAVQSNAMRRGVSELIRIRGEMQAIRIILTEARAPSAPLTGYDSGNA